METPPKPFTPEIDRPTTAQTDEIEAQFLHLLELLRLYKPSARNEFARYFAIVTTELEKAFAVFMTYIVK